MSRRGNNDTISKITLFRLKEATYSWKDIDEYYNAAENIENNRNYKISLWLKKPIPEKPIWNSLFKGIIGEVPDVQYSGFILLVFTGNSTYACTGGYGYHKLHDNYEIESRFGLIIAKKILNSNELKSIAQKSASGIINNLERVFRGNYNPKGDLDNFHRIVTSLRGSLSKNSKYRVLIGTQIKAADSFLVSKRRNFEEILKLIHDVDEIWNNNEEKMEIPELEQINPKYNRVLIKSLKKELASVIMRTADYSGEEAPNLYLDNINMEYLPDCVEKYLINYKKERVEYDNVEDVYKALSVIIRKSCSNDEQLSSILDAINIELTFNEGAKKKGRILKYICGDIEFDGEAYFINNGDWYKANDHFINKINKEIEEIPYVPAEELKLCKWEFGEDENAYNEKHAQNGMYVLHGHVVRIVDEKGPIEFCDIMRIEGGKVWLIHVKKASGANLRVLFAQGMVSAKLYAESSEFRENIHNANIDKGLLLSSECRDALSGLNGIKKKDINVIFAIYDNHCKHYSVVVDQESTGSVFGFTLSLFAKVDLLYRVLALRSCNYNVALTRIKPYLEKKVENEQ